MVHIVDVVGRRDGRKVAPGLRNDVNSNGNNNDGRLTSFRSQIFTTFFDFYTLHNYACRDS